MQTFSLFSIDLDSLTKDELAQAIERRLGQGNATVIATVNPEILLRAKKDPSFIRTLKACTFRVIDGFGILVVAKCFFKTRLQRMTGRDVVSVLFTIARRRHWTIGLFGGTKGRAPAAISHLQSVNPGVAVIDLMKGQECLVDEQGELISGKEVLETQIERYKPQVCLVALGAPKQERWMQRAISNHPSIQIAVGIGGLIDVFAHAIPEPPVLLRRMGLEWLWRFWHEPKRFTRIVNAVIVFPFVSLVSLRKKS